MSPHVIGLILVFVTAFWVGIDASNLQMQRGRLGGGFLDMGVAGWVFACLIIWIVGLPCYLVARGRYKALANRPVSAYGLPPAQYGYGPNGYGGPMGPAVQVLPEQTAYDSSNPYAHHTGSYAVPAQPPISPDGRWWWNGYQWLPMTAPTGTR
jgi:hypothetical protein